MIQCGWHFYKFVDAIIAGLKTNKFYEYGLMHGLALFLICFSYLYNYLVIGTVVLFLHDVGDLGVLIAEIFAEYGKRLYVISGVMQTFCYSILIYTRNYVFPKCIITGAWKFTL